MPYPVLTPSLIDALPVAVVCWDRAGRVRAWNGAAEAMFGWPADAVMGEPCPLLASLTGDRGPALRHRALSMIRLRDEEVQVTRADGSIIDVSLYTAPFNEDERADERAPIVVAVASDITERQRRTRELRYLATHDPLTDLHNRRSFRQSLGRIVTRVRRGGRPGSLLVLDLDRLKSVNDAYGHTAGDEMLLAVADVLRALVRPGDLVGRLGGDEFAVALERVGVAESLAIADRLRASIAATRVAPDGAAQSTVSIGGILVDGTLSVDELLACADDALYRAKQRRDSVEMTGPISAPPGAGGGLSAPAPRVPVSEPAIRRARDSAA